MRSKILVSLLILIFFRSSTLFGQLEIKSIVAEIKNAESDEALQQYLIANELINAGQDSDVYFFSYKDVKIDVFRKNLFGDKENEIILQIRDKQSYVINCYYYDNATLKKIHGQIEAFSFDGEGTYLEKFIFYFEEIFNKDEFAIIAKESTNYQRFHGDRISIYKVSDNGLVRFYDFESKAFSYSGLMLYEYFTKVDYHFELRDNMYPKVLVKHSTFFNKRRNNGGDFIVLLSGSVEQGWSEEVVTFANGNKLIEKTDAHKDQLLFVNSVEDIKQIHKNRRKDIQGFQVCISYPFIEYSCQNPFQVSGLEEGSFMGTELYKPCLDAYIKDDVLHLLVRDSLSLFPKMERYSLISGNKP